MYLFLLNRKKTGLKITVGIWRHTKRRHLGKSVCIRLGHPCFPADVTVLVRGGETFIPSIGTNGMHISAENGVKATLTASLMLERTLNSKASNEQISTGQAFGGGYERVRGPKKGREPSSVKTQKEGQKDLFKLIETLFLQGRKAYMKALDFKFPIEEISCALFF